MSYNGYTSWNAWNVSLWINNEEEIYRHAVRMVKAHGATKAAKVLADQFEGAETPDGAKYNITAIRQAIRGIL